MRTPNAIIVVLASTLLTLSIFADDSLAAELVVRVVVFPKQKTDLLVAQDLTKPLQVETLTALLKQGVGRIVVSPRLVNASGNEASIYDVQTQRWIQQSGTAPGKENAIPTAKPLKSDDFPVGYSFKVMAILDRDRNTVDLDFYLRITENLLWQTGNLPDAHAKVDGPDLRVEKLSLKEYVVSAMFTIDNGETKIIASAASSRADEVAFIFLTGNVEEVPCPFVNSSA